MSTGIARVNLLLLFAVAACGGDAADDTADGAADEQVLTLQAADIGAAEYTSVSGGVLMTGTLNPAQSVEVRAQIPGVVSRLGVDRGDAVRAGQVIAVIEAEGIRSAAAGAQAGVAAAESNLALARQRYESARKLYERGAMSQIDLQTAEAGYRAAESHVAAARAQLSAAAEAASRASVTAPISGEVSKRDVSAGEAVHPGQPLVTIVNSTSLELAGQVPVQSAVRVQAGQRVEFTIDVYPGQVFNGVVARVEPTADPNTRQVGVYLRLPNTQRRLVGGVFAAGRILTDAADSVLSVPAQAVRTDAGGTYVYVLENDRLVRTLVGAGISDAASGRTEIVSGLNAGDRVLVAPGAVAGNVTVRVAPATPAVREGPQ
ncbi:MAG TPA: efflux RND transporter periplasmic adaptor subunit [Longimicrobiales bacterium]|nr:efflux RND transporter periplasmic adaptor subunit [Longimicrobiales bacterium]